ncbi:MAG: tRNA pseudouridine(55) synthase TruB [Candidatus Peribacteraceae bacterium]|nr:tRNA pseudouridine(55) synthase TruB [Candidatus Peribacteraceae bacterium]
MRHGFLLIDKPLDFTSHDAVAVVRKTLPERAIGHLGTLDPAATGLLVLAVGKKALKVVQLFMDLTKEYEAGVKFGQISTTYDREGVLQQYDIGMGWNPPEQGELQRVIKDRFIGKISQVPPSYSAISIGGERAYRKARQGRAVDLPARDVNIEQCEILSYAYPNLTLRVACGSGTYVRSLAHDLGQVLRCGAYLSGLKRTKVGEWSVTSAKAPDAVNWTDVIPLKDVLKHFPRRDLTDGDLEELTYGRNIEAEVEPDTIGWHDDLPVAILVPAPDGTAHARKVF